MNASLDPASAEIARPGRTGWAARNRLAWHAAKLALFALLAYLVWRGYQNPDLILDYGAWRLC